MEHDPGCGANTREPLAIFDRDTCSWRTSQYCFLVGSTAFSESWPRSGTMQNGTVYPRRPLVPLTSVIGSGLWPTLTVNDGENYTRNAQYFADRSERFPGTLAEWVATRPGGITPAGFYGRLNPRWCEWLMGYPHGWASFADSATP